MIFQTDLKTKLTFQLEPSWPTLSMSINLSSEHDTVLLCVTWCCVLISSQELQQQLQRLMNDKARLEERVRDLEAEKNTLEVHMCTLLSHDSHMTVTLFCSRMRWQGYSLRLESPTSRLKTSSPSWPRRLGRGKTWLEGSKWPKKLLERR